MQYQTKQKTEETEETNKHPRIQYMSSDVNCRMYTIIYILYVTYICTLDMRRFRSYKSYTQLHRAAYIVLIYPDSKNAVQQQQ